MRCFFLIVMAMVLATRAAGVGDSRPDVIGVYFDESADILCRDDIPVATPFPMWVVYTNPTVDAYIGFLFGVHHSINVIFMGMEPPCGIFWPWPPPLDSIEVVCAEPLPTATANTLLRLDFLALGSEASFWVSGWPIPDPYSPPAMILPDYTFQPALEGYPALITQHCALAEDNLSWGSIKSLYR